MRALCNGREDAKIFSLDFFFSHKSSFCVSMTSPVSKTSKVPPVAPGAPRASRKRWYTLPFGGQKRGCAHVCLGTDFSPPSESAPVDSGVEADDEAIMGVPSLKRARPLSPINVPDSDVDTVEVSPLRPVYMCSEDDIQASNKDLLTARQESDSWHSKYLEKCLVEVQHEDTLLDYKVSLSRALRDMERIEAYAQCGHRDASTLADRDYDAVRSSCLASLVLRDLCVIRDIAQNSVSELKKVLD